MAAIEVTTTFRKVIGYYSEGAIYLPAIDAGEYMRYPIGYHVSEGTYTAGELEHCNKLYEGDTVTMQF